MSGPAGVTATTLIALALRKNLTAVPALITTTSVTLTWSPAGVGVSNYTIFRVELWHNGGDMSLGFLNSHLTPSRVGPLLGPTTGTLA